MRVAGAAVNCFAMRFAFLQREGNESIIASRNNAEKESINQIKSKRVLRS